MADMKINYKKELERCVELLGQMMSQADEDTPYDCRTRHFEDTLMDSHEYITHAKEILK